MTDWKEIATIITLMMALNGGFLWACKAMLDSQRRQFSRTFKELHAKDGAQDRERQQIREELANFRVLVSETYLRREDSIVWFGRFEQKIDAIWQYLLKLSNEGT